MRHRALLLAAVLLPFLHVQIPASVLPGIWLAEVTTGAVTPVLGTDGMFQAVTVS
jgi:hypothetical protein